MSTIRRVIEYDPAEMARRGRIGAAVKHLKHDPRETTRIARAAFDQRFYDQVDPGRVLPEDERERLVDEARRAYFSRISRARKAGAA